MSRLKKENSDRGEEHRLLSFPTTAPDGVVGPVHPKAMPVLLTSKEECGTWLEAPTEEALRLQRPLPDGLMKEVARGERHDGEARGWDASSALPASR